MVLSYGVIIYCVHFRHVTIYHFNAKVKIWVLRPVQQPGSYLDRPSALSLPGVKNTVVTTCVWIPNLLTTRPHYGPLPNQAPYLLQLKNLGHITDKIMSRTTLMRWSGCGLSGYQGNKGL